MPDATIHTITEPADRPIVAFEYQVDLEVWFRNDALAEKARAEARAAGDDTDDDERWFKVGEDDAPTDWRQVLVLNPDVTPALLTRTQLSK